MSKFNGFEGQTQDLIVSVPFHCVYEKIPQGVVFICPGDMHMYMTINFKFHVEPPLDGGGGLYMNGPGHMTKMAT